MIKFCQHPHCDRKAVWGIQREGESGTYNVCVKHRTQALDGYQKLGYTPKIVLLTA